MVYDPSGSPETDAALLYLDNRGQSVWHKKLSKASHDDQINAITVLEEGVAIIGSNALDPIDSSQQNHYLQKYSLTTGAVIWSKLFYFVQTFNDILRLATLSSGDFVLAGEHRTASNSYRMPHLMRIDANGEVKWA